MICTLSAAVAGLAAPAFAGAGVGKVYHPQATLAPLDIATLPDNRIVVATGSLIWAINTNTDDARALVGTGQRGAALDPDPRKTQLNGPEGVAVHPDGRVLIADHWNHRVLALSADHSRIDLFAGTGTRGDQIDPDGNPTQTKLKLPSSVAVFPDGRVLICEQENHRVLIVSADGRHIEPFAGTGYEDDTLDPDPLKTEFSFPEGVAVHPDGRALIADTRNRRVLAVSTDRTHLEVFAGNGTITSAPNTTDPKQTAIHYPTSISAFPDGRVLITDVTNHQVLIVNADGTEIKRFAGTGTEGNRLTEDPLQSELNRPHSVHVLPPHWVLLADRANNWILSIT